MEINLAHSPDSDDAYMFYALATGKIDTGPYQIQHHLKDIESLNRAAQAGVYDISAISLHAYPFVSGIYQLLPSGASVGDNYGPMLVSKTAFTEAALKSEFTGEPHSRVIGVPGERTTAFLALKLFLQDFRYRVIPFEQIIAAVQNGEVDAGLLIHEGQLNYADAGLKKVVDLGVWWRRETGLPLPLGANVIRRDLPIEHKISLGRLIKKSIEYSLSPQNQKDALAYSLQFARGLDLAGAERFVQMYVNNRTVAFDAECLQAIDLLYERAHSQGLIPKQSPIDLLEI